ncbi:MarR family winged helix-turn-helix transcriptional regulator [Pseudoxanthomonas dokdonensis]|uniref:MarR family transcriptional regulator n=1 Tax=Pseudoxanthomonas dokdonensis TaxID=344882 RepID=A0A0R0CUM9_9GAMM|nr:MarR family transcriptional regulator [Pseudoxanthomonas dokdonensis]KRG68979.1 MarR family transcriptional regulator [Pseudoxanthomonas dokdonensis]
MNTRPDPNCSGSSFGLLIRQVRDALWARIEHELQRSGHGLTFSQYITLKKLAAGVASATDLARAAEMSPGAMTRVLDKLESAGLIARVADPEDRRALHIHMTDAGHAIWGDVQQCGMRVLERAFDGMDENEQQLLTRLLEKARTNLALTDE